MFIVGLKIIIDGISLGLWASLEPLLYLAAHPIKLEAIYHHLFIVVDILSEEGLLKCPGGLRPWSRSFLWSRLCNHAIDIV